MAKEDIEDCAVGEKEVETKGWSGPWSPSSMLVLAKPERGMGEEKEMEDSVEE